MQEENEFIDDYDFILLWKIWLLVEAYKILLEYSVV